MVRREVAYLAKSHCVLTEDLEPDTLTDETLVRIAPAGFVHLDMIGNASYWSAVAEDTWFEDHAVATRISKRIGNPTEHYLPGTVLNNARDVLAYIETIRKREEVSASAALEKSRFDELTNLDDGFAALTKMQRLLTHGPWVDVQDRYPQKSVVRATIVNSVDFGLFAELEPGVSGLLHSSKLPQGFLEKDEFAIGEEIFVVIGPIDPVKRRIELTLGQK